MKLVMLFKDLKKSLKEKVNGFYVLSCGKDKEDIYLKSSCLNNLKIASTGEFIDFNLQIFTNETINLEALKVALNTLPFLSEKKLVVIKENDAIKNKDLIAFLKQYALSPVESSVLVIDECENSGFSELENLDGVCLVDCSRVEKSILESFILRSCSSKQFSIDRQAVEKLINFTDGYMSKIDIELDKLFSFKFDEKIITCEDIENNVSKSDEYQIFELTNNLFSKNAEKALFIIDDIIKNKKNISSILSLIFNHIRRSFYVKISKQSTLEIAKMLDVKEFAVKKLKEQIVNVSAKKLKDILVLCKDTDYKIKSGNLDLVTGIYCLVFTILVM